jgi:hypothetical protein
MVRETRTVAPENELPENGGLSVVGIDWDCCGLLDGGEVVVRCCQNSIDLHGTWTMGWCVRHAPWHQTQYIKQQKRQMSL